MSEGNEIDFNKQLKEYSLGKRKHIGKFKKLDDWNHWVDFNALAVCAYAKRKNIAINHQSEYIPLWLIE